VTSREENPLSSSGKPDKVTFVTDFRQFFKHGLAALLPTLITIFLVVWIWNTLWAYLGRHLMYAVRWVWRGLRDLGLVPETSTRYIYNYWSEDLFRTKLVGVLLAIVFVYILGLFVGNLLGRTFWKLLERLLMKIPIVRAIYPAVKQVTDFVLTDRTQQFQASRVVAVQPHEKGIWSIGLVTGPGLKPLSDSTGQDMVTVFIPSSPTAFTGYVLVVPRASIVELPLKVEEAMRILVSGGVLAPTTQDDLAGRAAQTQSQLPDSQANSSASRQAELGT
jgi:uncharacterized membrane protein